MEQPQLGRFGNRRLVATGDDLSAAAWRRWPRTAPVHRFPRQRGGHPAQNAGACGATDRPARGRRHVLAIADTSEFDFATHTGRKVSFGTAGRGKDIGLFVHPIIAVDTDHGSILGLVGAEVINRTKRKVEDHKTRPADAKERRRWLARAEAAGEVLAAAAMITRVEDREGDIYDQFTRRSANVRLLVRAAQNRSAAANVRLFEQCAAWSEVARHIITVPAKRGGSGKGQQAERTAVVAVRFGEVMVRRPGNADKSLPADARSASRAAEAGAHRPAQRRRQAGLRKPGSPALVGRTWSTGGRATACGPSAAASGSPNGFAG